jgi:hypothetical protein
VLEYKLAGRKLTYRWTNCVDGFNMPVQVGSGKPFVIAATTAWKTTTLPLNYTIKDINKNYYITVKAAK